MATSITIKGEAGGQIQLTVRSYERASSPDPDDENWLTCGVTVQAAGFRGRVEVAMQTYDFVQFGAALDALLGGAERVASLSTMEEGLELSLESDRSGHVVVSGAVFDTDRRTFLTFAFETDQTYLRSTQSELRATVAAFPVR